MFSQSSKPRSGTPSVATGVRRTHFFIIGGDVVLGADFWASVYFPIDGRA